MVKTRCLKPVSVASPRVCSPLARMRTLTTPKKVRLWLGLSLADVGREVARLTARVRPYDRRTIFGWESSKPMGKAERDAYGILIANKLSDELGRVVGVKLITNSPWRVTAWASCANCGSWFQLSRARSTRCKACARLTS